jgi:ATP-dependent DNA ligase
MEFKTLYKKTSTGAIQYWEIYVLENPDHSKGYDIWTKYGQVGGKEQKTVDIILEGKNIGKANETSPLQQAKAEAEATWTKKKKSGYVESIASAQDDETDALIEGGILPMLAHTFDKQGHKIKYPCYTQPKLDGIRIIAILKDRKCTLWSRTRKPITSLPHIIAEIEKHFIADITLDGEAYSHAFKENFEHIVHIVRQEKPDPKHTDVEYHVYDVVNKDTFEKRHRHLSKCFTVGSPKLKYLKLVDTEVVEAENDVALYYDNFKARGYEGAMLRNVGGLYANKRSSDLIKVKEMQDAEFKIVGIEEGRGKLSGHVGAFVCVNKQGNEFKAKMSGATEKLKEYFDNHSLWKNQVLTVQFQDLTSYGIPRFPVGLRIRNDE